MELFEIKSIYRSNKIYCIVCIGYTNNHKCVERLDPVVDLINFDIWDKNGIDRKLYWNRLKRAHLFIPNKTKYNNRINSIIEELE